MEIIVKDNLGNANANTVIGLREDLTALLDAADSYLAHITGG
jgi:hypothetical protein